MRTKRLSELIFGKELDTITLDDLELFFSEEQQETSILEFKTGDVSVEGICKEVSAFLNTEGGVLIIGTPKEKKNKLTSNTEVTVCQGELIPSKLRNKDSLMTYLVSNISPPPLDIKIHELLSKNGSHFIVEVPQSIIPPHQSNRDGRYYIRMERDSRPAPHGLVEALFFKRQKPKLNLTFNLKLNEDRSIQCVMTISNISPYPTEKVSYTVQLMNVGGINPKFKKEIVSYDGEIFYLNYTSNQVLWKGLFMNPTFDIEQLNEPFYISILAWSREAELTKFVGIYDPREMKFIEMEDESSSNKKGDKYYRNLINELVKK